MKSITVGVGRHRVSRAQGRARRSRRGRPSRWSLSDGPPDVRVPNLANMTCAQAAAALQTAHFKAVCAPGAYNNNVAAGVLDLVVDRLDAEPDEGAVRQHHHAGALARAPAGDGARTSRQTYTFAQAQAALQAVGLTATQNNAVEHDGAARRRDLDDAGQRGAGALRLGGDGERVDRARRRCTVPNVKGDSVQQATTALQGAGLSVSGVSGNPHEQRDRDPALHRLDRADGFVGPARSRTERDRLLVALPFDPSCDLCEAARLSEWHHEDDVCWVADCEVCGVPMVVWKHHGPMPPDERHRAHGGAAEPGGRRPLRAGRVVGRPGDAPDPEPLPRARARPATGGPLAAWLAPPMLRRRRCEEFGMPAGRVSADGGDPRRACPTRSSTRSPTPAAGPWGPWGTGRSRPTGSSCCTGGYGPGGAEPPLPVVGARGAAGRAARTQHHLHRLRGGAAHGQGGLPHQLLGVGLGLDGPAAGLRRGGALLRQGGRPLRPPPPLPVRTARGHGQRRPHRARRPTWACCSSPAPSTGCRARRPAPRRWRSSWSSSHREDRVKALGWWSLVGAGGPVLGVTLGSPVIQYFGWRTLFWGQLVLLVIASVVVAVLLPSRRRAPEDGGRDRGGEPGRRRTSGRAWTGWAAGAWPAA